MGAPEFEERKYTEVVNLVEDIVGGDVDRDLLEMAIASVDTDIEVDATLDGESVIVEDADGDRVIAEQLDTGVSATDVAFLTYLARTLNSVGEDELVSRVTDSSGSQVDPATNDDQPNWFDDDLDGVDIGNGGSTTRGPTSIRGTKDLNIALTSDAEMDVVVEWLADDQSTVLFTTNPAALQDTTNVDANIRVRSFDVQVVITDTSAGQNAVSGTITAN